jgi:hypothetical protein
MSSSTNGRTPKQRHIAWLLVIDGQAYRVSRLDPHAEVATRAYQVEKLGDSGEVYHVRRTPQGWVECSCQGGQRWGHCKHADALAALGCLVGEPKPAANGNGHTYPLPGDDRDVKIVADPPSTPTVDDWADVRAAQLEAEAERAATYQMLVEWARDSLASAAVPCCCVDHSCQRCKVQDIVA